MNHLLGTIAIKGGYANGNFGDDALMVAAYEIAKKVFESQSIYFLCRDATYIQRLIPDAKVVSQSNGDRIVANILLYGGGTQFYSFPLTMSRRIPSFNKILRHVKNPSRLVQRIHRKIVQYRVHTTTTPRIGAIGIGLGPFVENSRGLHRAKKIFTEMEFVAVRDIDSFELCKKWEFRNLSLGSDLCYLPDFWKAYLPNLCADVTSSIKKVGVIIRDWPHTYRGDSYAFPLFQVVDELRSTGKEVEFISFARRSDSEWAKRLNDKDEQFKAWNPEKSTISEFMELLSGYDAFITARYHGAVFASILGKPVVCVEVEQKLRLVSDLFGNGARLWTYPFNAPECLRHISDLAGSYWKSVERLARVVEEQGALAKKMVDDFELFIRGKNGELYSRFCKGIIDKSMK